MNMRVLLARQGPPIEVEVWTRSPSPTSFPFLLGYGMDKDPLQNVELETL